MKELSDAELMKLVMEKDRAALEHLYDRYVRLVYSFAMKSVSDEARARVVIQAVFTRLWTTEKGYNADKGTFVNWLLTITRNCAIDELRKERRHAEHSLLPPNHWEQIEDDSVSGNPEQAMLQQDHKEQITIAMKRLSANQSRLLRLLYWEGYSLRDIAHMNNEPIGTVKSRLHQTLKVLRNNLTWEGERQG